MSYIPVKTVDWKTQTIILNISLLMALFICVGISKLAMLFAGYLILSPVLTEASHIVQNDCTVFEYKYKDWCCPLCEAGMRVSQHCTPQFSTECKQCPDGEFSERDTGSEKCLEFKSCDHELGFQIEQPCGYTHDTTCEPMTGYYCIENCVRAKKHTACPAGQGVKEKGTRFKDTVCEKCSYGTFSNNNSSTEECKNWTVCETLQLKEFEPGSAEADVTCAAERNRIILVYFVAAVILFVIMACVFWRKWNCKAESQGKTKFTEMTSCFKLM